MQNRAKPLNLHTSLDFENKLINHVYVLERIVISKLHYKTFMSTCNCNYLSEFYFYPK